MSYPQQPWGQPPQQPGYPPQQPQQGYPQQGYPQQPQGYPAAYPAAPASGGSYDFGQLYGQADHSDWLYPEGPVSAVVEDSSFGRTKDGTKGMWTLKLRTTEGDNAGRRALNFYITITADNSTGLGMMFRRLAALGIPVPDPKDSTGQRVLNGQQPFWAMGWKEEQVAAAMIGKPVTAVIKTDEYNSRLTSKVDDIQPPRPGAPTDWPRTHQAQPGGFPQPVPQGYAPPQPGYAPPQQIQAAPGPWQGQQPAQAPQQAPAPQGQQPVPGAPAWAQPPVPGQGGYAEFTPQGQGYQPSHMPPPAPGAPPMTPQAPPAPAGNPAVPQPPWQGQPQAAANGQVQPQQEQPGQQPGAAPPQPPWAS